jgi:hypothetical protein
MSCIKIPESIFDKILNSCVGVHDFSSVHNENYT